jgi:hypothetical protein
MAGWADVAVIVGGSAGALIGALFVAVSIKIDIIGRSTELRNRAAQALVLFGAPLTVSVLLAVPDQPVVALGGELVTVAVLAGTAALVLDRRAKRQPNGTTLGHLLQVATPNGVTVVLTGAAGVILLLGFPAGLFLLTLSFIASLIGGAVNAWLLLTRTTG